MTTHSIKANSIVTLERRAYAGMYGPTTGDRVRLGDTELFIEVERDHTIYGEEVRFGRGRVIRDGMGQSQRPSDMVADTVISNALIVDHWGIVKADIGLKGGRISSIGKAGNPDVQPGVDIVIGAGTEIIAGEGLIATAGGIDSHMHFISPQLVDDAMMSGITTMIGGGTGPAAGASATACTPGSWHIGRMYQALDELPVNIGLLGKGNASLPLPLTEQIEAGAMGLELHEDWGTTPAAIDNCLTVADKYDVQVAIHVDALNESGFFEDTLATFKGRAIHTFHGQGLDSRHAPDMIRAVGEANVLPSSTTGAAFEDVLHDKGAVAMMASGSQVARTWQTAHKLKVLRGPLPQDSTRNDNFRVRRFIAKYTINPAITHGIAHEVGSIETGKLADIVLWKPAFFGVRAAMIIKGGMKVAAPMGHSEIGNTNDRPSFGSRIGARAGNCVSFVSQAGFHGGIGEKLGLSKRLVAVRNTRAIGKKDLILNAYQPKVTVDSRTCEVRADGVLLHCEPVGVLPLAQRYFLF